MDGNVDIIGIDPSLTSTGICLLHHRKDNPFAVNVPAFSLISPKTALRGPERLLYIADNLLTFLSKTDPYLICIEGYAYARDNRAHQIGELGGLLRILLHLQYRWIEIAPASLKKYATGKGNATKDKVMASAISRYNVYLDNNNIVDAYLLAQMGLHVLQKAYPGQIQMSVALPKHYVAAIEKPLIQYKEKWLHA